MDEPKRFKTVIVNLERRTDRREYMVNELKRVGWNEYEFFKAVDGRTLVPNDELQTLFANNHFNSRAGVIGCAMSHYRIWQQLANDQEADFYVIMEDDIVIKEGLIEYIQANTHLINSHPCVLFQHSQYKNVPGNEDDPWLIAPLDITNFRGGCMLFSLNKAGANILLDHIREFGIHTPIDNILCISSPLVPVQLIPMLTVPISANENPNIDTDIQKNYQTLPIRNNRNQVLIELLDTFVFMPRIDNVGGDLERKNFTKHELGLHCKNYYQTVGFNSFGYVKIQINNLVRPRCFSNSDGIYVKKRWVRDVANGIISLDPKSVWNKNDAIMLVQIMDTPSLKKMIDDSFVFYAQQDSPGNDYGHFSGSIDQMLLKCLLDSSAIAVNTNGQYKHSLVPLQPFESKHQVGLYIKKSYLTNPILDTYFLRAHSSFTFDNFFDKIFVINRATDTARWDNAVRQLSMAGINKYERFEATTPETMAKYGWKLPTSQSFRLSHKQLQIKTCIRLSFFRLYTHILNSGYQRVLILEDDIKVDLKAMQNAPQVFHTMAHTIKDWDYLYLFESRPQKIVPVTPLVDRIHQALHNVAFGLQTTNLRSIANKLARSFNWHCDDTNFYIIHPTSEVYRTRDHMFYITEEIESTYKDSTRVEPTWVRINQLGQTPLETCVNLAHMFHYHNRYHSLDMNPLATNHQYTVMIDPMEPVCETMQSRVIVFFTARRHRERFDSFHKDTSNFLFVHSLDRELAPVTWSVPTPPCFLFERSNKCQIKSNDVYTRLFLSDNELASNSLFETVDLNLSEANEKFKYTLIVDSSQETNCVSHLVWEAILAEQLVFYAGQTKLDEWIPSDSFIPVDPRDPNQLVSVIQQAIETNAFAARSESILKAKELVLTNLNLLARVESILGSK